MNDEGAAPPSTPLFTVLAGQATEEETAALTVALIAASSGQQHRGGVRRAGEDVSTAWNQPSRRMRPVVRRGYRAWRRNALPR